MLRDAIWGWKAQIDVRSIVISITKRWGGASNFQRKKTLHKLACPRLKFYYNKEAPIGGQYRLNWSLPGRAFHPTNVSLVSFVCLLLFLCFSSRCIYLLTHFDCISFSPHYDSFHSLTLIIICLLVSLLKLR